MELYYHRMFWFNFIPFHESKHTILMETQGQQQKLKIRNNKVGFEKGATLF